MNEGPIRNEIPESLRVKPTFRNADLKDALVSYSNSYEPLLLRD